jgi:Pyruvate/2-oxoacid:ferredoxin oxidoreductase gamma subunit
MGDGAAGIGGTHFLNVARRNIGITLLIGNNFNYGMTGGQHSVTTPTGGRTSTTPWGNPEGPMDLCGTAAAAGAAWVYRATMFDGNLPDVIATAIEQPGFAMMDVWELCTAYYMPRNDLKRKELLELLKSYGYTVGLQADKPRPEYTVRYREAYEAGKSVLRKKKPIEPQFGNSVKRQTGIVIAGSAGQKIKSAATSFAEGAMFAGLNATEKDDYPITVQTGHSVAEIIVSPEHIEYTGIEAPDYFILISEDGLKRRRAMIKELPETSTLYADESIELPATKARIVRLPLAEVAGKVGKLSVSIAAFAAMLEDTGIFPIEALNAAIRAFQSPKIVEASVNAVSAGAELSNRISKAR